ncbi:MAG: MBL fold metallo-hydrolase [Oscillospiraceae bacterium]|nr:MBL fold metallo-hydrolase [Oscillospiraceae bacterium]
MNITWHGHSCFSITSGGYTVVLDPYADGAVPGYAPLRLHANEVLCSHAHADHSGRDCVTVTHSVSPFRVTQLPCFHDEVNGAVRGANLIHILEAENLRIAHFGDLGHDLTAEQMRALGRLDCAMLPVGGHYTIAPEQAAALAMALGAALTIPMHYRMEGLDYDVLQPVDRFASLFPGMAIEPANAFTLPTSACGVHVLTLPSRYRA